MDRRSFLKGTAALSVCGSSELSAVAHETLVNDVHTGLNPTKVERVVRPASVAEIRDLVRECRKSRKAICVSGSRHATGGQQFAEEATLIDMRGLNRVIDLNANNGILQVEAGIEWPELIKGYSDLQPAPARWGIRQKQGGADRMTLGGALAANAHGHGLGIPPMVSDVEWIDLVGEDGEVQRCDRSRNKELFSLAIGGYGLFGIIVTVGLRLAPRRKLRRRVEKRTLAEALPLIRKRTENGATYGYFQYSIVEDSPEFLRTGILTTYEPVDDTASTVGQSADVEEEAVERLLDAAHLNRGSAYQKYATLELEKDGLVEWSDLHQLSSYPVGYHKRIDARRGENNAGADLIFEVYVPRDQLIAFVEDARSQLLGSGIPLVYGTIRFIEKDRDTFLAWAKRSYACVIFTPHVAAGKASMETAGKVFRKLEQSALKREGSFYLTYNRFAMRAELEAAYPQFSDFLTLKRKYDPGELFQSDWYRFYKRVYS